MNWMKAIQQNKFRFFLWALLILSIIFFIFKTIAPFGKAEYSIRYQKSNKFFGKLAPMERISYEKDSVKINGGPVYFSLNLPRKFDKAKLTIEYKNNGDNLPVIEAGVLADNINKNYQLKPIENKIIDKLSLVWNKIEENGRVLLQKEKKFNSISEFEDSQTARNEIALYNIDYANSENFEIKDYQPKQKQVDLEIGLRGGYEFYAYLDNEDLDIKLNISDLNLNDKPDEAELSLYYGDELLGSEKLADDGISGATGKESGTRTLDMKMSDLPTGVYKLVLRANDDVVTKKIKTKQKISFCGKLWFLEDNKAYSVYTNSSKVSFQTENPSSLQNIKIAGEDFSLNKTYYQFEQNIDTDKISEIKFKQGGIVLSGNGIFSFNKNDLFDPRPQSADENLDAEKVNYIFTNYQTPAEEDGWKTAQTEFDLSKAYWEKGKLGFIISIPNLRADDNIQDDIEVKLIKIELQGKTFMQKIKELIKKMGD